MRMLTTQDKPKHTPGPWYHTEKAIMANNGGTFIAENPAVKWEALAELTKNKGNLELRENIKQANANARLMAAAPIMLEALQAVADSMEGSNTLLAQQVRDAIRKATE